MKPTSTFKLKKSTKTILSRIVDPVLRNHFRRMMVDAQLASQAKPSSK